MVPAYCKIYRNVSIILMPFALCCVLYDKEENNETML